jgi:hypothetical protein
LISHISKYNVSDLPEPVEKPVEEGPFLIPSRKPPPAGGAAEATGAALGGGGGGALSSPFPNPEGSTPSLAMAWSAAPKGSPHLSILPEKESG